MCENTVRQCSIRFANNNQSQLSESYGGHGLRTHTTLEIQQ